MQEKNNGIVKKPNEKKLKFWHYLLIFVVLALFTSAILTVITPQTKKISIKNNVITSNYDKSESTFKKVVFSGQQIAIPEKFGVFRVIQSNNSADLLASQLINGEGMSPHETITNYWKSENSFLSKSDYEQNYTFSKTAVVEEGDLKIIKDEAIRTCLDFYSKYNVNLKLTAQKESILYFDNGNELNLVGEKEAYSAQIPLTYELNGYPVFYQNENDYPFFCKIDNNYNLDKVVFKNFFYGFEVVEELPSISIDKAIDNIKNGIASIISAESQIVDIIDLDKIIEADLYSVEIDYRYDDVLKIVYPFYKFKAKITNAGGINIQSSIITPAVATAIEK